MDLTPTILQAFALPVPDDTDGEVLTDLFSDTRKIVYERAGEGHYREAAYPAEDAAKVQSHLRDLGYLE